MAPNQQQETGGHGRGAARRWLAPSQSQSAPGRACALAVCCPVWLPDAARPGADLLGICIRIARIGLPVRSYPRP